MFKKWPSLPKCCYEPSDLCLPNCWALSREGRHKGKPGPVTFRDLSYFVTKTLQQLSAAACFFVESWRRGYAGCVVVSGLPWVLHVVLCEYPPDTPSCLTRSGLTRLKEKFWIPNTEDHSTAAQRDGNKTRNYILVVHCFWFNRNHYLFKSRFGLAILWIWLVLGILG